MIDNDAKLEGLLERLRGSPWVALDTEADSLHAYPEKICLVQISTPAGDELIDPLARLNVEPLLQELTRHELIMHGADYDLRLFRKHHQFVPSVIFDTMLASRLLGITQFGLTHLVGQFLGVTLDKGSQKADWAQRPLTPRMEIYARNDTHYLKSLSDSLKVELVAKRRLSWHQESCARLIADCAVHSPVDPDSVWRIKGSHRLGPPALAVLRELWHWRETEAITANRPPYFILRHETLIDLAIAAVGGRPIEPLVPPKFSDRRRAGLTSATKLGLAMPHEKQPQPVRHAIRRVTDAQKRRVTDLQNRRDAKAKELSIDPTLIASRATLLDLAEDWNAHEKELMNWQRELLK
ncbi:MAG TPA: HRDC domain-containing protein [Verrucomicrobiae bacterium]|nr:HRDC domain-containing protein [Verrucomicrobiae bacterium]